MPAGQHPLRSADGRGDARVGSKTVRSGLLIAVLALVLGPFVARVSWFHFQLTSPVSHFPAHWVRPSTEAGGAAPVCATLLSGLEGDNNQISFCEDAEMLHGPGLDGWALLSCDPGRDQWNTVMGPMQKPEGRGALWMYAYSDAVSSTSKERQSGTKLMNAVKPLRLSLEGLPSPYDFHPLGIAVHPMNSDGNGAKVARLFVINHQRARSTIDVFDLLRSQTSREGEEEEDQSGRWRAVFVRSLVDPIATHTPNSLVALSADEVLVTQDHLFALRPPSSLDDLTATWRLAVPPLSLLPPAIARYCAQLARLGAPLLARIETLLGLPLGWVTYVKFDDDDVNGRAESHHQTKIIARWIAFANGLALSPNGKFLAVASTMMPGIKLYEWSEAKREVVRLAHRINTPNLSDNIAFTKGASGIPGGNDLFGNGARLIGGGGPSGLELMRFARDPHNYSKRAHSWIISISPTPPKDDSNDDDDSYVSANARMIRQNEGFHISTVYQGHGPVQRVQVAANLDSETEDGQDWIGIASATSAAYDGSIGGGTLLVPGLYSKPGVMVCANVGL